MASLINFGFVTATWIATIGFGVANATPTLAADEWRFNVLLDGKRIGYHRFQVRADGPKRELLSEARFTVRFLFVSAYRYAHDDHEIWSQECLAQLEANTNDNGARRVVNGLRRDSRFAVSSAERTVELEPCVQTFAYWNPEILHADHLLNPQTGEYVPVRISNVGVESLVARGIRQPVEHYRIVGAATIGGALQIDLWYSLDKNWLALESLTVDGRHLRYEIL